MEKKDFVERTYGMRARDFIFILFAVFVFSGVMGFVYETFFYRIDLGYFTKRGTTFGPWIPIYGFGGLFITLIVWRFKTHPAAVFFLSGLVSGVLEFSTGYVLYHFAGGLRLWDYNTEIWNWGNIGGYVCLRSVLLFAIAGTVLIYLFIPSFEKLYRSQKKKIFQIASSVLAALFLLDIILSSLV